MKCPFCQNENTRVLESRQEDSINAIRRRRICDECDKRFTTHEKIDVIPLTIIKKDGTRVEYDRGKIEAGILRSCHKRPISIDAITQLVDSVEARIFESDKKEIPSRDIGEWVMENLKHLDPVAYVRFASVYREFKDAPTFMDELAKLLGHEMEET
jgi:transcriptional repressor NrdR